MAISWKELYYPATTKFMAYDELNFGLLEKKLQTYLFGSVAGSILGNLPGKACTSTKRERH
jgi:hypothetical protein